jgi:hypothetical protein
MVSDFFKLIIIHPRVPNNTLDKIVIYTSIIVNNNVLFH